MSAAPAARRSVTRSDDLALAALRALGRLGFAALALFHVCLLGVHLLDGRAFAPATAIRWALAAGVLVGLRALSRRGLPLFSGRRAVGLWLLVVIIHCGAAWEGGAAAALDRAIPESVTALAQLSAATAVLGLALAAALASAAQPWAGGRPGFSVPVLVAGLPASGFLYCFSPRPPPLA
jgi:hypothetical protein